MNLTQLQRRLAEACDDLWSAVVDPHDALYDADGVRWQRLGERGSGGARASSCASEHELAEIRSQCRVLAATNEFAINGHENRVSYAVGVGHVYLATARKHAQAPPELAAEVQAVIDDFVRANAWRRRQQELVLRMDRDGEAFLRYFAAADGSLRVRFVEPGQVYTPPARGADPAGSFGIETDPRDVETALAYYIDGEAVDAHEIQHRKAHVDANVKRGLPLFYPVRKNLLRADKLLRNMSVVAEIQSAIALIRKHRRGTRTAVQQFVGQQADAAHAAPGPETMHTRRYAAGTILDAPGDTDYEFPAAGLDAGNFVTVLQAELRAIAARLVMPEFMLTSDASNANYASTMVAEGPAVRMFERLQARLVADDLEVLRRAVAQAVSAGHLPSAALDVVEIQALPPTLAVRDRLAEARAWQIASTAGILSPQTWSARLGLDYDQEQANLADHAARRDAAIGAMLATNAVGR